MKISDLLSPEDMVFLSGTGDTEISSIVYHSDKAVKGSLFFAIEGQFQSGADHIEEAADAGAAGAVTGKEPDPDVLKKLRDMDFTLVKVENPRLAMAKAGEKFYGDPSQRMLIIGVTGTKGKTTVTFMIRQILENAGIKTGITGTVINGYEGHIRRSSATTPQAPDLSAMLAEMAENGCSAAVTEVSSQGLMHGRTEAIDMDIGVFMNISPDHIGEGEHRDFSDYLYWKSTLFRKCRRGILNADDPYTGYIVENSRLEKTVFFGESEEADFRAEDINFLMKDGKLYTEFTLRSRPPCGDGEKRKIKLNMPGRFNVQNALAAAAVTRSLGIPWSVIEDSLRHVYVPGRTEITDAGGEFTVMTDYAHNGAALRNLLTGLREYSPERIILVFGCGGNRDKSRRTEMGRAAAENGDVIIITSDNPRREDPRVIAEEIYASVISAVKEDPEGTRAKKTVVIPDRRQAIRRALNEGRKGDLIVIAGKGHETCQITGDEVVHFDDREEITAWRKDAK